MDFRDFVTDMLEAQDEFEEKNKRVSEIISALEDLEARKREIGSLSEPYPHELQFGLEIMKRMGDPRHTKDFYMALEILPESVARRLVQEYRITTSLIISEATNILDSKRTKGE